MSGKNVVAIVQARMDSTRLPGKVLLDLGGWTMLARVVRRTSRASRVDGVVVATSTSASDDPVVEQCRALGVAWYRGSQEDVLDRYYEAAVAHRADVVVRITSDCPLIDPEVIDLVVGAFLDIEPDYASNTVYRTYPRGLDTEVVSFAALKRAWREALVPYQRIHVTPYFYQNPEIFAICPVIQREDLSGGRWTVDTPQDLELLRAIYDRLGPDDAFSWRDVYRLLCDQPHLAELNGNVRQKRLVEG
jgi:spore coat polysaccharide biosynthesis protein SpsF